MTSGDPEVIARSVESTHAWLRDLCDELGSDDRRYAYRVLRAVLHVLRDRLPVDESAQLAAQLPELVRGVYYEGWRPSATPHAYHDARTFLDRVAAGARLHGVDGGLVRQRGRGAAVAPPRLRGRDRRRAGRAAGGGQGAVRRLGGQASRGPA